MFVGSMSYSLVYKAENEEEFENENVCTYTFKDGVLTFNTTGKYIILNVSNDERKNAYVANRAGYADRVTWEDIGSATTSDSGNSPLTYEVEAGETLYIISGEGVSIKDETFKGINEIFAEILIGLANGIVRLVNLAVGGDNGITMDDIIFNHYEPTQLSYYKDSAESGEALSELMKNMIIRWANIFTAIAVVAYLAILLYIGIQILLKSTAQKRAEYQRLLMDWLIGVGLLFFFPLVAKYSIEINDALVRTIEKSKSVDINNTVKYNNVGITSLFSSPTSDEQVVFGTTWTSNPFASSNDNYMANMQHKAERSKSLAYAFVYFVMTVQLIIVIVTYYRRTFMVGFLIVLFPLVAMTYALDKIKDGKSQAFDRWAKELLINVFLQTFHAIIYVFALNASFAGGENADWLLMIIGVSFLFKGEEIIRNLFGQKSDSAPSLAGSAVRTIAAYQAVTKGASKLKDNFIGKDSHLGRAYYSYKNARNYEMMAQNFDRLATTGPAYNPDPMTLSSAPKMGPMDADSTQLGKDILTINHMDAVNPDELAQALLRVQNYSGPHADMLEKDLQIDSRQISRLQTIKESAAKQLRTGTDKATVDQNIRIELETMFKGENVAKVQQALYRQMAMPLVNNHARRNTDEAAIRQEASDAIQRRKELRESFKVAGQATTFGAQSQAKASDLLFDTYGTVEASDAQKAMAKAVTILAERSDRKHGINEQVAAMKFVMEHKDDEESFEKMTDTLGVDLDELNLVLAHRVKHDKEQQAGSRVKDASKEWADKTIEHYDKYETSLSDTSEEISVLTIYEEGTESKKGQEQISDEVIKRIANERIRQNREEAELLREFAVDRIVKNPEPTVNGMTKDQILAMAEDEREKAQKDAFRAVAESAGAVVAAPIGAAAGIAFAETKQGPIAEGIAGAFGGAVVGDQAVSKVLGETREREYIMRNPYTGEDEKVILKVGGAFGDHISYSDPALPEEVRGRIREQFIASAAAKRIKEDNERIKRVNKANNS